MANSELSDVSGWMNERSRFCPTLNIKIYFKTFFIIALMLLFFWVITYLPNCALRSSKWGVRSSKVRVSTILKFYVTLQESELWQKEQRHRCWRWSLCLSRVPVALDGPRPRRWPRPLRQASLKRRHRNDFCLPICIVSCTTVSEPLGILKQFWAAEPSIRGGHLEWRVDRLKSQIKKKWLGRGAIGVVGENVQAFVSK